MTTATKMTLGAWLEAHPRQYSRRHGEMQIVHDDFTDRDVRAELWHLSDFVVTSVASGVIWLAPRAARENPAPATKIQTLIFDRDLFSQEQARGWARNHGFDQLDVDEKTNTLRLRQRRPAAFQRGTLRTIQLTDGVQAVIGRPELASVRANPARANPAPHLVVWVPSQGGFVDEHGGIGALADAAVTHSHEDAERMAQMHQGEVLGYDAAEGQTRENPDEEDEPTATSSFVPHEEADELVGRRFRAPDGVCVVLAERTPGGLYFVQRPSGWKQAMRPSIIRAALERSEDHGRENPAPAKSGRARRVIHHAAGALHELTRANPPDVEELEEEGSPGAAVVGDVEIKLIKRAQRPQGAGLHGRGTGAPDDILVEVSAPAWEQTGEIDADGTIHWPDHRKLSKAVKLKVVELLQGPPWSKQNTSFSRWEERDNLLIHLVDARGHTILALEDDDARELFADGFLHASDLHGSLVKYANTVGAEAE